MENTENELILSFDMLYTNNHIQILKLLLPCFEPEIQKKMAVMIKYLEFQYTLDYFSKNPQLPGAVCDPCKTFQGKGNETDIVEIFSRIRSFCTPTERAMFDQLSSLKKNMDMYEEMMNMFKLFSDLAPEPSASSQEQVNPIDLLKNMLSPEQQTMFDMFQSAFSKDA